MRKFQNLGFAFFFQNGLGFPKEYFVRKIIAFLLLVNMVLLSGCAMGSGNKALLYGRLNVPVEGKYYKTQLDALLRDPKSAIPYTNWMEFRRSFYMCRLANPKALGVKKSYIENLNHAVKTGDVSGAAKIANKILDNDYTNITAHRVLSTNLTLGENEQKIHENIYASLLNSIAQEGDGSTKEKAYFVINSNEETELLASRRLTVKQKKEILEGKLHYDIFTVQGENGEIYDLYFDTSLYYASLE